MTQEWSALGQAQGKGAGDQVIYYRRPRQGENAGWITWGDNLSGSKLRDFVRRGFEPLMKYGVINSAQRDRRAFGDSTSPPEGGWNPERYLWEAILSHPDGPAEFPLEQIVAYRWYNPERCPVPGVAFPQLQGQKITEYKCPERCGRDPFIAVNGVGGIRTLRQHLRVMHDWDQANLMAYGERVGIDFTGVDVEEINIEEFARTEPTVCQSCGAPIEGKLADHQCVEVQAVG